MLLAENNKLFSWDPGRSDVEKVETASVLEVNRVRQKFWLHLPRNRGYSAHVIRI